MSDYLKKLAYFAYMRCEDTLWVSNIRFNGIFSIDLKLLYTPMQVNIKISFFFFRSAGKA